MPGVGETAAMQALGVGLFGSGVPKNVLKDIASSTPAVAKRGLEKAAKYFIPKGQAATPAEAEMVGEYLSKTITQKGVLPTLTSNVLPLFFGGSKQQLAQAKKPVSQNVLIDLADKINIDPTKQMSQRELVQAATAQGKEAEIGRTALEKIKEATQTAKQKFAERYNEQYGSVTERPDIRAIS